MIDRDAQRAREDIPEEEVGDLVAMLEAEGRRYEVIDQDRGISEVSD